MRKKTETTAIEAVEGEIINEPLIPNLNLDGMELPFASMDEDEPKVSEPVSAPVIKEPVEAKNEIIPANDSTSLEDLMPSVITPAKIEWEYEKVKNMAEIIANTYKGQVITDENFQAVKATDKEIGSYIKTLNEKRLLIKRAVSEPIDQMDAQFKEITDILKAAQEDIKAKYKPYDEERLAKRVASIEKYRDKQVSVSGLRDEYSNRIKITGVTLSSLVKTDKANVDTQIAALVREQTVHDQLLTAIASTVETGNLTVSQKFGDAEKENYLGIGTEKASSTDSSIEDIVNDVVNIINNDFEALRAKEDQIRQEAIAKEKERLEEEARQAAIAAQSAMIQENYISAPEPAPQEMQTIAPSAETAFVPQTLEMTPQTFEDHPVQVPQNTQVSQPAPADVVDLNRSYHFTITLDGPFGNIRNAGKEILEACRKYGVTFTADAANSYYTDQNQLTA